MVKVPQAPGPPAPSVQQIQQAPPQAASLKVDMFSVFQTAVSFITWTVRLLWSNVIFSEFSCSSGYCAFTNSVFMLPYFDLGRQYLLGSPNSYVIFGVGGTQTGFGGNLNVIYVSVFLTGSDNYEFQV